MQARTHLRLSVATAVVTIVLAGQRRFVDLSMHMPPSWGLGGAAVLRPEVERAPMGAVPGLCASLQLLPMDVQAHSVGEEGLI